MPVSQGYTDYVLEQLERVATVTSRKMFGGLGIYSDGKIFAIIDDDTLFYKVDDTNRQDYLDAGMPQWAPGGMAPMKYFQLPAEVLEDSARLRLWTERAIAVAHTAKPGKPKPRPGSTAKTKPKR